MNKYLTTELQNVCLFYLWLFSLPLKCLNISHNHSSLFFKYLQEILSPISLIYLCHYISSQFLIENV